MTDQERKPRPMKPVLVLTCVCGKDEGVGATCNQCGNIYCRSCLSKMPAKIHDMKGVIQRDWCGHCGKFIENEHNDLSGI